MPEPVQTYIVGDVQGCCASLEQLLEDLPEGDTANLWFAGDLINRGPDSLGALRLIQELGARAVCVLGNHDLHLLAAACSIRKPAEKDTLQSILEAPERDELVHWLRHRPLAHLQDATLLVHAGVLPQWSVTQTMQYAAEVEQALRSDSWVDFLKVMYGNTPQLWRDDLSGDDRLRAIVNVLTRMRMIRSDGAIDLKFKGPATDAPAGLTPWFDLPHQRGDNTVVFGHWSTLGLILRRHLIGLDTGCVWGGRLTAVRLSDRAVFQVSCPPLADTMPH